MHVLILPSWYFSSDSHSIAGKNFQQLAVGLREADLDARIFHVDYSMDKPFIKQKTFNKEEGVPTWRTHQWFPPKIHSLLVKQWIKKSAKEIFKYVRDHGKPDLIHAQSFMASLIAREVKTVMNVPFIYTEHLSGFISNSIGSQYKKFISKSCENADIITCVSPGLRDKLRAYTSREIVVVPNFFDSLIFHPDESLKKDHIFTWISIGEPSHIKGLDILINSLGIIRNKRPDIQMKLIFIDEIRDKEKLIQLAQSYNVDALIDWKGLITQKQIAHVLNTSHALVSSSRIETFGTAIIEAQACGLPVVATETDGAHFIIKSPEQGLLVKNADAEALSEGMIRMMSDYSSYNPEKIIELVKPVFEKESVVNQWKNIYYKVTR
ncbi:MAG TPA: glycosyltransferase [Saprospiraceae bacterium]|nr:glycosyltransferase [Saprospiraceae bacterium]